MNDIRAELAKLSIPQRKALRARWSTMTIAFLKCTEFLGKVDTVHVGFSVGERTIFYRVWIGPRGGLRSVKCLGYGLEK